MRAEKTRVNFRIEKKLKEEMEDTCRRMGITMTTAFCNFCQKVVLDGEILYDFCEEKKEENKV